MLRIRTLALAVAALGIASPSFAALKPGDRAPAFRAQAYLAGRPFTFDLSKELKKGPVVVYFFPAANTPGCNVEARQFSEAIERFRAQRTRVVGLSAGNVDQLADFSKDSRKCGGRFPVAADPGAKIAKQYDSVLALKPGWSNRTSYLVTPDGRIAGVHSDLNPGRHVRSMLTAATALRARTGK